MNQEVPASTGTAPSDPVTPDGRYFVVRGRLWRLWRLSEPALDPDRRNRDRSRVDAAKHALGERGPVWRTDGAPGWKRHLAKDTPYASRWASLQIPPATTA